MKLFYDCWLPCSPIFWAVCPSYSKLGEVWPHNHNGQMDWSGQFYQLIRAREQVTWLQGQFLLDQSGLKNKSGDSTAALEPVLPVSRPLLCWQRSSCLCLHDTSGLVRCALTLLERLIPVWVWNSTSVRFRVQECVAAEQRRCEEDPLQ